MPSGQPSLGLTALKVLANAVTWPQAFDGVIFCIVARRMGCPVSPVKSVACEEDGIVAGVKLVPDPSLPVEFDLNLNQTTKLF
ncbi:uncharacterized protein MYCFIDRAFT_171602 [Pseudocercospora fijiensis CIRAD86]|uniref:Uncharacterized protein n=1 Tax=Pseudocercospora fijiensis (strain CIRAD86) TaxID=383855 RepID=M3A3Q4_PSEFD|nr:uncharacterized protein MYCFIDRAFT_171602 [Pseudocercospora fijiensis CIRAD86]EME85724.1 hypothetical protein MYCFIDRAFT_171602 [Pseudocercospora fijiensis CIRAD86]